MCDSFCRFKGPVLGLLLFVGAVAMAEAESGPVLVLGDSLSAGYGLSELSEGWVARLAESLNPRGIRVVNAGISGDTTAGGRQRLPGLLDHYQPAVVVIELGGNDGLRGLSLSAMAENLEAMAVMAKAAGARVLLLGMQLPAHYGSRFTQRFEAVYPTVADKVGVALVPNLLAGIGDQAALMQADGIHPGRAAQIPLRDRVLESLNPLLTPESPSPSRPTRP